MRKLMTAAAAVAALMAPALGAPEVGQKPPKIEAVKWYNTPPLALEQLQGQAVLVEVFRTW